MTETFTLYESRTKKRLYKLIKKNLSVLDNIDLNQNFTIMAIHIDKKGHQYRFILLIYISRVREKNISQMEQSDQNVTSNTRRQKKNLKSEP